MTGPRRTFRARVHKRADGRWWVTLTTSTGFYHLPFNSWDLALYKALKYIGQEQ